MDPGGTDDGVAQRKPGRPRSEDTRDAILRAALELAAERGHSAVSIETIARRARAGKQTIYRWWPAKGDVLMEALAREVAVRVPLPDEGSWAADLRRLIEDSVAMAAAPPVSELVRALAVEAQLDPEFGERFRADFLGPRRAALAALVERARERGDLPDGLTPDFAADVVFGVLWYQLLAVARPFEIGLVDRLVALLARPGAS